MPDIAVRVEATGGTHTNAASETSSVFDVRVVAGVFDENTRFDRIEDGRPVIPTNIGAVLNLQAFRYALDRGPDGSHVSDIGDSGMYADNPTTAETLASQLEDLVQAGSEGQVLTFIGTEQLDAGLEQLALVPGSAARYIASAIAIATDHTRQLMTV